jgi:hypothetical protein
MKAEHALTLSTESNQTERVALGWRVKLYQLESEGTWIDRGTGWVSNRSTDGVPKIAVISEDEQSVILESKIRSEDIYERQGESIIMWREPASDLVTDDVDYALSFQDFAGCVTVWEFIIGVQRQYLAHQEYGQIPSFAHTGFLKSRADGWGSPLIGHTQVTSLSSALVRERNSTATRSRLLKFEAMMGAGSQSFELAPDWDLKVWCLSPLLCDTYEARRIETLISRCICGTSRKKSTGWRRAAAQSRLRAEANAAESNSSKDCMAVLASSVDGIGSLDAMTCKASSRGASSADECSGAAPPVDSRVSMRSTARLGIAVSLWTLGTSRDPSVCALGAPNPEPEPEPETEPELEPEEAEAELSLSESMSKWNKTTFSLSCDD